jgi:hypothetical protein
VSATAETPNADYRRGWDDATERVRRILAKGKALGLLELAVALIDVDLAADAALAVLQRAAPPDRVEAADARH